MVHPIYLHIRGPTGFLKNTDIAVYYGMFFQFFFHVQCIGMVYILFYNVKT